MPALVYDEIRADHAQNLRPLLFNRKARHFCKVIVDYKDGIHGTAWPVLKLLPVTINSSIKRTRSTAGRNCCPTPGLNISE